WISAIDPFNANIFYFTHGDLVCELDIDKGETGSSSFPDSITFRSYSSAFFVPVMLPAWIESYNLPCTGIYMLLRHAFLIHLHIEALKFPTL
uniref:DUF1618 domain-containing protein n=1 Tax=Aegilops tauschii subsp. strangulata TaxID=200361 RepID=A0A452ZBI8_AEGTS